MKSFLIILTLTSVAWAQPTPPPPSTLPPKPLQVPQTRTSPNTEADGAIVSTDKTMPNVPKTNTRARRLVRPANTTLPTPTTPNTPRPNSPNSNTNVPSTSTVPNTTSPNTPPSAGGQ